MGIGVVFYTRKGSFLYKISLYIIIYHVAIMVYHCVSSTISRYIVLKIPFSCIENRAYHRRAVVQWEVSQYARFGSVTEMHSQGPSLSTLPYACRAAWRMRALVGWGGPLGSTGKRLGDRSRNVLLGDDTAQWLEISQRYPFRSRQIKLSISSHCLRVNTAGHA